MKLDLAEARKYANLELLARQLVEGFITGLHKSPYHGFSVEFAEHKIYNTGEPTRHIDWKLFARTDRLYTKRYEEETNLRCQILIDTSSSMYYPAPDFDKLSYSLITAAAIAWMLQGQRDAVGVTTFSDKIEWQTPVKSTSTHIHKVMLLLKQLLETTPTGKKTAIADTIHLVAESLQKRGLVVLFSDMLETNSDEETSKILSALQHLKHNQHEVLLFHTYHGPTELNLELEDRPWLLIDPETQQEVKVRPEELRTEYAKTLLQRQQVLKLKCNQYKIDYIPVDVTKEIDQVLIPYLSARNKVRK